MDVRSVAGRILLRIEVDRFAAAARPFRRKAFDKPDPAARARKEIRALGAAQYVTPEAPPHCACNRNHAIGSQVRCRQA